MALLRLNISLRFRADFCLFVEPPSLHGIPVFGFLCRSPLARCSRLFSLLLSTDGPAQQCAHAESCRAQSSGIGNGVLGVPFSESARARIVQAASWPRVSEAGLHICNSKRAPRGLLDGPRGIWEPPCLILQMQKLAVSEEGGKTSSIWSRAFPAQNWGGGQDRDWGSPSCHSGNSWVQSDKRLKGSVVSGWSRSHIFPVLLCAMLYLFMRRRGRERARHRDRGRRGGKDSAPDLVMSPPFLSFLLPSLLSSAPIVWRGWSCTLVTPCDKPADAGMSRASPKAVLN